MTEARMRSIRPLGSCVGAGTGPWYVACLGGRVRIWPDMRPETVWRSSTRDDRDGRGWSRTAIPPPSPRVNIWPGHGARRIERPGPTGPSGRHFPLPFVHADRDLERQLAQG